MPEHRPQTFISRLPGRAVTPLTLHAELYGLTLPTFSLLLIVTSFGARGFRSAAHLLSGIDSPNVRSCETLTTFRRHLKSHLFHPAFNCHCL